MKRPRPRGARSHSRRHPTALSAHFFGTIDLGDGPVTWEGGDSIPYVAKFDAPGELAWKKHVTFGGTEVHALATGPDGTVALGELVRGQGDLLGREVDTGSGVAEFVAALSPDGDVRFVELFEGSGRLRVEAVAVAEDGRVAVGGVLRGDVTIGVDGHEGDPEGDAVVALFGPDGRFRAAKLAPAEGKQEVEHLAFGPGESLSLLASGGSDFGGGPVHGLVTLGPALEHVASREVAFGSSTSLTIGGDGSVVVGGSPFDGQVSVFGSDGALTFTQGLSSGHGSTLLGVAASGQGRYAISGEALNEVSVGELPILSGGRAAYVAELAADGTPLRALTFESDDPSGQFETPKGEAVAYGPDGAVLVRGHTSAPIAPLGLEAKGNLPFGGFLLKLR